MNFYKIKQEFKPHYQYIFLEILPNCNISIAPREPSRSSPLLLLPLLCLHQLTDSLDVVPEIKTIPVFCLLLHLGASCSLTSPCLLSVVSSDFLIPSTYWRAWSSVSWEGFLLLISPPFPCSLLLLLLAHLPLLEQHLQELDHTGLQTWRVRMY